MYTHKIYKLLTLCLVISLSGLAFGVNPARAEAPANDDFDFATPVLSLPFSDAINTTEATLAFDDPVDQFFCGGTLDYGNTVWYAFTPSVEMGVSISPAGSDYLVDVFVYTGSRGSLSLQAGSCDQGNAGIRFRANAGTTYFILVVAGNYYWSGPPTGGNLVLNITEASLPPNDNFANATVVSRLPFTDSVDTELATLEADEPAPCGYPGRSIWFTFTPQTSGTYTASVYHSGPGVFAAYSGDTLENLTTLGCVQNWGNNQITLPLQAGTTYYYQTGMEAYWGDWDIRFTLDLTPPPDVSFGIDPYDPSKIEMVHFYTYSSDPGGMPLSAWWDFGDGVTSTEWDPSHQYLADGDYTVQLTVTAPDGRSATASQLVQVRTHDVAITRFTVPQSASAGQTRQVTVYVNNKYYDETVQVHLYKSSREGYVEVGTLTLWVPGRSTNKTVAFAFSYTFTPEDAVMGKVTFRASADPLGVRDVLPADNEVIALPTKVNR